MNLGEKLVRKIVVTGFSLDRNHRIIASDEVFIYYMMMMTNMQSICANS